jgi:hypothetical protein
MGQEQMRYLKPENDERIKRHALMASKLYNFPDYFLYYRVWEGSGSFHQSKSNTESALRITRRHRHDYAGFVQGVGLLFR